MNITALTLKELELPGEAGRLYRAGAIPSLVRELGDNYQRYHDFLAAELEQGPKRPDPDDYSSIDDYLVACRRVQEIVLSESFLRSCVEYRRGRPFARVRSVALIDDSDRLVAAH